MNTWFQIQFIEPQIHETAVNSIFQTRFSRRERYASIVGTPEHDHHKQQMKMKNRQMNIIDTPDHECRKKRMKSNPAVTVGTPEYEKHKEKVKLKKKLNKSTPDSSKIQLFKKEIQEGPFFVCVVCNRCLYKQSVRHFNPNRYQMSEVVFSLVPSYDGLFYICKICDSKVHKDKIPCQAVYNKSRVENLPQQ